MRLSTRGRCGAGRAARLVPLTPTPTLILTLTLTLTLTLILTLALRLSSLGVTSLNESIELSLALNLHDFEPAASAHGAPALRYTYYYHATTVLEPSGGPSPLEPAP